MPKPIPLHRLKYGVPTSAGTGFLVSDDKSVWFATAIHNITGEINSPADGRLFEGIELRVVDSRVVIPLFEAAKQRFIAMPLPGTSYLVDATTVKLTPLEANTLAAFGCYKLASIVTAAIGETLGYTGFAGMQRDLIAASTYEADVKEIADLGLGLSKTSLEGVSGAAVTNQQGGLVGLMRGNLDGRAIVVRFDALKRELFA